MTTTTAGNRGETLRYWAAVLIFLAMSAMLALVSRNAAAAPAAGTVIGNQATATYNDAGGAPRTATSNLVQTTVSQVKSFTLTADGARTAAPGQTVYYPHTITNTGNDTDTYALKPLSSTNFAGAAAPHGNLTYYIDANGDGVPDNATPITGTGPIASGGIFRFVVAGTVPGAAASTDTATITVSVQDNGGSGTTATNADTTTVASSVITVTKSLSSTSGPSPSGQITVTLSYTNSGTAVANDVELRDVLPAGMTYVPNSGVWSGSATALTDAALGDPAGIAYDWNVTVPNRVTAKITTVPANFSGSVSFKVTVNAAPGMVTNIAQYLTATQTTAVNTNPATYQVLRVADVITNGSTTNSNTVKHSQTVTQPSAGAGSTFTFSNVVWNTGNAADTFVVSMAGQASWPAGTTFTLLQSDGATSLIANTTPQIPTYSTTGPNCPAGYAVDSATQHCGYIVILKVQLPANASGGPYSATITATSSFDGSKSDSVTDTLTTVAANTVDLTYGSARSDSNPAGTTTAGNNGFGSTGTTPVPTAAATVTPSPTGPTVTRFPLYVNNTGAVNDNFTLSTAGTPAGWSVVFRADGGNNNCSTVGSSLTSTGTISAGSNRLVCAEVTVPATTSQQAAPNTYSLDFSVASATNPTGVTDSLRATVTVTTVSSVSVTPNNTQQTFPGGSITYTHTIANLGNNAETISFASGFLADSRAGSGWTSAAYVDGNGNGIFEPGVDDVPANLLSTSKTLSLPVNGSVTIFVRVFASPSAVGTDPANVTTLTAKYNGGTASASATDTTSATDGLVLLKEQRTTLCTDPNPATTYSTAAIPSGAATAPGQCLQYRITATNTTASSISAVVVNDNIPASTHQWNACGVPATTAGTITSPGDNATGKISASIGALAPLASAQVTFCVRIDP